ncbi:unnamed protein product [Meganyctiphanes norvegica]|uniref:Uncharacterized protein n=1 Tax=Meganyctiphanes norvegica TaxID=48144 RepID=A0AAV2QXP9_MEGNR
MSPYDMSSMLCGPSIDMAVPREPPSGLQDAHKSRRSNKPQMERRRRERINQCLNELKSLVLTAQKKDPSRYNKLEKADILEMTVRHVQTMHCQKSHSPRHPDKYNAGYSRCATEVTKFLESVSGIPEDLRKRITSHINPVTAANQPRLSPKPDQCNKSNIVTTTVTVNPPKITISPLSSSDEQLQQDGTTFDQSQVMTALSLSGRVTLSGSPHTSATSPDAIGKPASPESAHGNSPKDCKSSMPSPKVNRYQDHTMVQMKPEASCLNAETPTRLPQSIPQDVPLDLAFNRCNENEPSLSNGQKYLRRQNTLSKAARQRSKDVRYVPYIHQNILHNNLHWRPW